MGDFLDQAKQRALKSIKDTYEKETKSIKDAYEKETKSLTKKRHHKGPVGKKDDLVDDLVRDVAATVGFFSEVSAYRKNKKVQKAPERREPSQATGATGATYVDQPPSNDELLPPYDETKAASPNKQAGSTEVACIHALSPLGDNESEEPAAQKEPATSEGSSTGKRKKPDFAADFLARQKHLPVPSPKVDIGLPVVLPQRRPKERARGFVRAYSPVLESAGISQEVFLDLIDTLNHAIKPNPLIEAINLAGIMPFPIPDPILAFVLFEAVEQAVAATMEAQSRHRSRSFLDQINAEFFLPRDLIALVVTWRPEAAHGEVAKPVDFAAATSPPTAQAGIMKSIISDTVNAQKEKMKSKGKGEADAERLKYEQKFRATDGSFSALEVAPLVFPPQDDTLALEKLKADGTQMNKFDRGEAFMDNYLDRRAQWKWAERNPEMAAQMGTPKATYKSKYSDPNHPAASGDIVAFATGGRYSTRGKIRQDGEEESEVDQQEREKIQKLEEKEARYLEKKRNRELERKPRQGLAGLLQQNLLYLVVVDVPEKYRRNQNADPGASQPQNGKTEPGLGQSDSTGKEDQ